MMLSKEQVIEKINTFLKKHKSHKTHEITHIEKVEHGWFVVCFSEKYKYSGYELIIDEEYKFMYGVSTIYNSLDEVVKEFHIKRKSWLFRTHAKYLAPLFDSLFLFFGM